MIVTNLTTELHPPGQGGNPLGIIIGEQGQSDISYFKFSLERSWDLLRTTRKIEQQLKFFVDTIIALLLRNIYLLDVQCVNHFCPHNNKFFALIKFYFAWYNMYLLNVPIK
jgi:hypothetical protein